MGVSYHLTTELTSPFYSPTLLPQVGLPMQGHAAGPDFDKVTSKIDSKRNSRGYKPRAARSVIMGTLMVCYKILPLASWGSESHNYFCSLKAQFFLRNLAS